MTWRPEDFEDLARDLRHQVGSEIRSEAEEVERLTEIRRRRRQTMADVAVRAMQAGDTATIVSGSRSWRGTVAEVGEDYLKVEAGGAVIEAPLHSIDLRLERTRSGGRNQSPASATWMARLAELALEETTVTLITESSDYEGRILLVAVDHLEFEGGIFVPLRAVRALVRSVV
jgi:hypothetical protein